RLSASPRTSAPPRAHTNHGGLGGEARAAPFAAGRPRGFGDAGPRLAAGGPPAVPGPAATGRRRPGGARAARRRGGGRVARGGGGRAVPVRSRDRRERRAARGADEPDAPHRE